MIQVWTTEMNMAVMQVQPLSELWLVTGLNQSAFRESNKQTIGEMAWNMQRSPNVLCQVNADSCMNTTLSRLESAYPPAHLSLHQLWVFA